MAFKKVWFSHCANDNHCDNRQYCFGEKKFRKERRGSVGTSDRNTFR